MFSKKTVKKLSIITPVYKSEKYLEAYLKNITGVIGFNDFEIILVLNDPNSKELEISNSFKDRYPENIIIIQVPLESIAASTNRGFSLAEAEFVTCADVDDWRCADCFVRQIETLNINSGADYTYGDFMMVPQQGIFEGFHVKVPTFNKNEATRSSIVGPNHFFRKKILGKIGYWDEQLKSGGDFEFQIRAALNVDFKKTEGPPLLYYTRYEGSGSASSGELQEVERTVAELRYGIYDKIDYRYLPKALEYDIYHIYNNGQRIHIRELVPDYDELLKNRHRRYFRKGIRKNLLNLKLLVKLNVVLKYFLQDPAWTIKKMIKRIAK